MGIRGGLGGAGRARVRAGLGAYAPLVDAELVDDAALPPGSPALLAEAEAAEVLALLDAAAAAGGAHPIAVRAEQLAAAIRARLAALD